MLRITLHNIRNLVSYEGHNTLCVNIAPDELGIEGSPEVCHDLEAARRTTTGTCPVYGRYVVYEEFVPGEDWTPIGMKQRGRWIYGRERCDQRPTRHKVPHLAVDLPASES